MQLKDFPLNPDNHFIAMEYYWLIMNRTYLLLITDDLFVGVLGNGLVAAENGVDHFADMAVEKLVIRGDRENANTYVKAEYIRQSEEAYLTEDSLKGRNKANFIIERKDIVEVQYDSSKKWGMGPYPHDGKVYVILKNGKRREFIILGNQSGERIKGLLLPD